MEPEINNFGSAKCKEKLCLQVIIPTCSQDRGGLQHIHIVVAPFLVHYRIDQHLCVQTLFSHFPILNSHARQQYFGSGFRGLLDLGSEQNILNVKSPQINTIFNAVNKKGLKNV